MCFVCARRKVCTSSTSCQHTWSQSLRHHEERAKCTAAGASMRNLSLEAEECPHSRRTSIRYMNASFLFNLAPKTMEMNLSMQKFQETYVEESSALEAHARMEREEGHDIIADWRLTALHPDGSKTEWLCCPEDSTCAKGCPARSEVRR